MPTGQYLRKPRASRVEIKCLQCGAVRNYAPSEVHQRGSIKFCSTACAGMARVVGRTEIHCATCGKAVLVQTTRLAKHGRKYCSKKCCGASKRVEGAKWRDADAIRAYMAAYARRNRDKFNAQSRQWGKENRHKRTAAKQRYRARLLRASTQERVDFQWIITRDGMTCYLCGLDIDSASLSFDHVVPLSRGGAHTESNIKPAHRRCNSRKSNRSLEEFRDLYGFGIVEVKGKVSERRRK